MGLEPNAAAVAKAEVNRRSPAGGLGHYRLELAPGSQDPLYQQFLDGIRVAVGILAPFQVVGRPVELEAILEDRGNLGEGVLAVARPRIVGDRLVDLDPVELVGQRETLDSGRKPRDRLVVLERLQGMRIRGRGMVVLDPAWLHESCQSLGAELAEQELCLLRRASLSKPDRPRRPGPPPTRHRSPSFFAWASSCGTR